MKQFVGLAAALLFISAAPAAIIDVTGDDSSFGVAPAIIPAPASVFDDDVVNEGMQGFDEAQGVLTTVEHFTDTGSIAAGTLVDSHMIFLNSEGPALLTHFNVLWTFSGNILGVMSDFNGDLEAASTFELGNPSTNYPTGFPARGIDGDTYEVNGNQLSINLAVTQPGDWVRVVTEATTPIPEPGSVALIGLGLAGLALFQRRRRA